MNWICIVNEQELETKPKVYHAAHKRLMEWFAVEMPNVKTQVIGPSEYSGWMARGPSYLAADFGEGEVEKLNSEWGSSGPWIVETWPY